MEASVILAKCGDQSNLFGIRVEKRGSDWVSTWAFPVDAAKAGREGFDRNKVTGSFQAVEGYPGCPYCGTSKLVQCGCEKMLCYRWSTISARSEIKAEKKSLRCPWCNLVIDEIRDVESFTVKTDPF